MPKFRLGAKSFLGPPPAKADIATAILTNVIEHLVLLFPPNKHAFTAKAVWVDFHGSGKIPSVVMENGNVFHWQIIGDLDSKSFSMATEIS